MVFGEEKIRSFADVSADPTLTRSESGDRIIFAETDHILHSTRKDRKFPETISVERRRFEFDKNTQVLRKIEESTIIEPSRRVKETARTFEFTFDKQGNPIRLKQFNPERSGSRDRMILKREIDFKTGRQTVRGTTTESDFFTPTRRAIEAARKPQAPTFDLEFQEPSPLLQDPGPVPMKRTRAEAEAIIRRQNLQRRQQETKVTTITTPLRGGLVRGPQTLASVATPIEQAFRGSAAPSVAARPTPSIQRTQRGEVRALTEAEQKAVRRSQRLGVSRGARELFARVGEFFGIGEEERLAAPRRDLRTLTGPELTGFALAGIGTAAAATAAPAAIQRAAPLASTAVQRAAQTRAGQIATRLAATRTATFLKGLGLAEVVRVGAERTTPLVSQALATQREREAMRRPEFGEAVRAGFQAAQPTIELDRDRPAFAQSAQILRQAPKVVASELNVLFTSREKFQEAARARFERAGLSERQVETATGAALKTRQAAAITELGALVGISAIAESTGRTLSSKTLAKIKKLPERGVGLQVFKAVAPQIGAAGFIEGFGQERAQQAIRMREPRIRESLIMGGFGAVTAAGLGGAIAATAINRKATSKALNLFANIVDPLEKPGDLLADAAEATARRLGIRTPLRVGLIDPQARLQKFFRVAALTPGITPTITPAQTQRRTPVFTAGTIETAIGAQKVTTPVAIPTPGLIPRPPFRPPAFPKIEPRFPDFSPVPAPRTTKRPKTPTLVEIIDNVLPTTPPTPAPTTPPTTPQQTPTPISVTVATPAPLVTPLPVVTPLFRIPPPIPLGFPGAGAGIGTRKIKKTTFVAELQRSQELFTELTGFGARPRRKKR